MTPYQKIITAFKKRKKGATAADICAATALPLTEVRQLLPKAADEYSAHLQVTESGEILYTFPAGFTSRYRGFSASANRFFSALSRAFNITMVFLFKAWIMIMLVGYFLLFLAIALAGVMLMVVVQSKSSGSGKRSTSFAGPNIFSLLWKIWFVNEMTKPRYDYYPVPEKNKKEARPMHKAIFSFVFGEEDPNTRYEMQEDKAVIEYIQSNNGVICLAEYMAFTGKNSMEAESSILKFCMRFLGVPEVTEEGTIVYRFDELMLGSDSKKTVELASPVKRLKEFSFNSTKMNVIFILINAVNFTFGSYFLYNAFNSGLLTETVHYQSASYLYGFTHIILEYLVQNPVAFIGIGLGIVPLLFSLFFWIIPAVRAVREKKENERTKLINFKKLAFGKIWSQPNNVDASGLSSGIAECRPKNLAYAADRAIKEMSAVSSPSVEISEAGKTLYSFKELEREKQALSAYRKTIDPARTSLGQTVFDTSN